jgi:hypothetical protein
MTELNQPANKPTRHTNLTETTPQTTPLPKAYTGSAMTNARRHGPDL